MIPILVSVIFVTIVVMNKIYSLQEERADNIIAAQDRWRQFIKKQFPNFTGNVHISILETMLPYREEDGAYSVHNHVIDLTYGLGWNLTLDWRVTNPNVLGHRHIALDDNTAIAQHGYMTYELFDDNKISQRKWIAGEDITVYTTVKGNEKITKYLLEK